MNITQKIKVFFKDEEINEKDFKNEIKELINNFK